jgi:hypothetical protein
MVADRACHTGAVQHFANHEQCGDHDHNGAAEARERFGDGQHPAEH